MICVKEASPILTVASFFTGIGGFDIGFEHNNMQTVFQCEINKFGKSVLQRHWSNIPLIDNIEDVTAQDIPQADVWCAGFPCQDLSLANQGKRQGLDGKRSGLFHSFADLLEQLELDNRPSWIVLENVPGLLNSHTGNDFRIILERLNELGYCVTWRVLDAKYFGTPQRRRRVFIVGSLGSMDSINVLFDNSDIKTVARQSLGIKDLNNYIPYKTDPSIYILQHATIGRKPEAGPQAKGYRNDGESYTLDSRGSADVIIRTSRPFILCNDYNTQSDSNRYRAIGNAVSINVIKWIGRQLRKAQLCKHINAQFHWNEVAATVATKSGLPLWLDLYTTPTQKWKNSGVMRHGQFMMGDILEHEYKNNPILADITEIIEDTVPLRYFLPSDQLQSILDRAEAKGKDLPDNLKQSIVGQLRSLQTEGNKHIDDWIKCKASTRGDFIQPEDVPHDILTNLKVRRLTPTEYESLQGFPKNWTLI